MTANAIRSREAYKKEIELGNFTELEKLKTEVDCTYYRCEYITASMRISQIVVCVFEKYEKLAKKLF